MKSLIFFAVTGSLMVLLVHWIRSLLCRPRNIFIDGQPHESRPAVLAHLTTEIPDLAIEHAVSRRLYPEE